MKPAKDRLTCASSESTSLLRVESELDIFEKSILSPFLIFWMNDVNDWPSPSRLIPAPDFKDAKAFWILSTPAAITSDSLNPAMNSLTLSTTVVIIDLSFVRPFWIALLSFIHCRNATILSPILAVKSRTDLASTLIVLPKVLKAKDNVPLIISPIIPNTENKPENVLVNWSAYFSILTNFLERSFIILRNFLMGPAEGLNTWLNAFLMDLTIVRIPERVFLRLSTRSVLPLGADISWIIWLSADVGSLDSSASFL